MIIRPWPKLTSSLMGGGLAYPPYNSPFPGSFGELQRILFLLDITLAPVVQSSALCRLIKSGFLPKFKICFTLSLYHAINQSSLGLHPSCYPARK